MHLRKSVLCLLVLAAGMIEPAMPATSPSMERRSGPGSLSLTLEGDISPELAPVAGQLAALYFQSYPKLLERFDNPAKPARRNVRVVFQSKLKVPGYRTTEKIAVSVEWLKKHPDDVGLLTHELTHMVQNYPSPDPGWLTEGLADYARYLYGPKEQPGWKLPERLEPRHSYKDGFRVTGRFLLWLDSRHAGVVDKLHRQMQEGKFQIGDFKTLTGSDIETLWRTCVEELRPKP